LLARRRRKPNEASDERKIYNRLAVLRAERNLSRKELAEAVDVNYQTIGYLERGDYYPSLDLALRIAHFFELPVETIFAFQPFRPLLEDLATRTERKESP